MISKEEIATLAKQLATPFIDAGPLLENLDEADLEPVFNRLKIIAYAATIAHPSFDLLAILPLLRHLDDDDFDAVMACATEMVRANEAEQ